MSYVALPSTERDYGVITAIAGTGGVTINTFVVYDGAAGTATTAGAEALGLMIALETAAEGAQVACKFLGLAYLSVDATVAITVGGMLLCVAGGLGYVTTADTKICSAIALGTLASGTGTIIVLLDSFTVSI